jgi:hypothetical protein
VPEAPPTNLRILEPSRKAVREGDVFAYLMPDERYRFGRVISTSARIGPMEDCQLLYFYERATDTDDPPLHAFRPTRLLIPPCMTNRLGWRRGYFKTVWRGPMRADDRLTQHCFWSPTRKKYFDDCSNELPGPVEPVGTWALDSFRTIDDDLSLALGLELAPD